jgi:hypothetical protein
MDKNQLNNDNRLQKAYYGSQFPSVPKVFRRVGRTPLNQGHTESVMTGYEKRVHNFLQSQRALGKDIPTLDAIERIILDSGGKIRKS